MKLFSMRATSRKMRARNVDMVCGWENSTDISNKSIFFSMVIYFHTSYYSACGRVFALQSADKAPEYTIGLRQTGDCCLQVPETMCISSQRLLVSLRSKAHKHAKLSCCPTSEVSKPPLFAVETSPGTCVPSSSDNSNENNRKSIMPGSNTITALRGFRVRLSTLDKFLFANGNVHGAENGFAPLYHFDKPEGPDEISALLRAKAGGDSGILYVVPAAEGHDITPYVYVAHQYRHVYSQLRITSQDPPEQPVPPGFEQLREEILGYRASAGDGASQGIDEEDGVMGLYIVYTEGRSAPNPPELQERYKVSYQHTHVSGDMS